MLTRFLLSFANRRETSAITPLSFLKEKNTLIGYLHIINGDRPNMWPIVAFTISESVPESAWGRD
jgi:hypothetical protein